VGEPKGKEMKHEKMCHSRQYDTKSKNEKRSLSCDETIEIDSSILDYGFFDYS